MAKPAVATPTPSLPLTDLVVGILTEAADQAVRTRITSAFMATWKMKLVKWGDPMISFEDTQEAMTRLIDVDSYVREYDDSSRVAGSNRTSSYLSGGDGRDCVSPDNYMRLLELSTDMMNAIEREEELTDLGFVPSITSIEAYDENMAWYKSRLDRNHVEEEAAKVLQGEKVKETKEVVKARLSNLR